MLTATSGTDTNMPIQINDSGTWRTPSTIYVNDSGTWRPLKSVQVNDAGTWRTVYTSSVSFSLTAAGGNDGFLFSWVGYIRGTTGSVTPTGVGALPGGTTFEALVDYYDFSGGAYNHSSIFMTGFSSDPGQSFFVSVDISTDDGPKNYTSASANGSPGAIIPAYSYSAGQAVWTWGAAGVTNEFDLGGIANPHSTVFNF